MLAGYGSDMDRRRGQTLDLPDFAGVGGEISEISGGHGDEATSFVRWGCRCWSV